MTYHRCAHFVRYEGCTVSIAIEVVGLMMLLRINALYPNHKWITRGLGLFLIIETAVNVWLISRGERKSLCIPVPSQKTRINPAYLLDIFDIQRSYTIQIQESMVSLNNHRQIKLLALTFPKPVAWFLILQCALALIDQYHRTPF